MNSVDYVAGPVVNSLEGDPEVGDLVKTLHLKRAIYGVVTHVSKRKIATVVGAHYDGGPERRCQTHIENLALLKRGQGRGAKRK